MQNRAPNHPRPAILIQLGMVDYLDALNLQLELHRLRLAGEIPDTLILLEHPPVITIGRSKDRRNLLASETELNRHGIKVYHIDRGGDITYHGPGQLIGYLIFSLHSALIGVRRFVEKIEDALILSLAQLGVRANSKAKMVGVWIGDKKVASLGIAVSGGVTRHGFALNVSGDLAGFRLINPCGMSADVMTTIEQAGGPADMKLVRQAVVSAFARTFQIKLLPLPAGLAHQTNLPLNLTSLTNLARQLAIASASPFR